MIAHGHSDEYAALRWKSATIDAYVPVPDSEDWSQCPTCHQRPRIWVFDNGSHASCWCCEKYRSRPMDVSVESVGDHWRKHKSTANWNRDDLRLAWNAKCAAIETVSQGIGLSEKTQPPFLGQSDNHATRSTATKPPNDTPNIP